MASQRVIWPNSAANAQDGANGALTNPTNVAADDGVYATCGVTNGQVKGSKFGNWGWDAIIPAGSTITDVQLEYQYKISSTAAVSLAHAFVRIGGTAQTDHTDGTEPTTDTVIGPFSIFSDRAWTRADLLDGTFEMTVQGSQTGAGGAITFSFDYIAVTVTWTPGGSVPLIMAPYIPT